jgi:hypothetical protein
MPEGHRRFFPERVLIWSLGSMLALVALLFVAPLFFSDATRRVTLPLAEAVPLTASDWEVKTLDVAESAEVRNAVARILRFDDVVYRSYRRGATEVQVYAAYWKPGSVPYGQAGVHTPDTCWVNAGWSMADKTNSRVLICGGENLKPSEWRRFTVQGVTLHVVFWHIVGDRVHTYEQMGWRNGLRGVLERLPNLFRDLRRYGFNLRQEQLFIRVSSNTSFEQLLVDPAFVELMRQLRPLGLFEINA